MCSSDLVADIAVESAVDAAIGAALGVVEAAEPAWVAHHLPAHAIELPRVIEPRLRARPSIRSSRISERSADCKSVCEGLIPSRLSRSRGTLAGSLLLAWQERASLRRLILIRPPPSASASGAAAVLELARAFAGELVPQDPADEPAAVLLARLRAERGAAAPARGRRRRG